MNERPSARSQSSPCPGPPTSSLLFPLPLYLPLDFPSHPFRSSQSSISELKSPLSQSLYCLKPYLLIFEWLYSEGQGGEGDKGRRAWGINFFSQLLNWGMGHIIHRKGKYHSIFTRSPTTVMGRKMYSCGSWPPWGNLSHQSDCVSHSAVSNSLQPSGLWPARLLCPWNSPGKNTRVGSHPLLQGIFSTSNQTWVSGVACRFFTIRATREVAPCLRIIFLILGVEWKIISLAYCMSSVQFNSVTQSCLTLCNPMECSTPGFSIRHQLPELAQTHVHWVGDAIQPSHPLLSLSPPAFNLSQHQGLFQWVSSSHQVAKVLEFQLQHQSFQSVLIA